MVAMSDFSTFSQMTLRVRVRVWFSGGRSYEVSRDTYWDTVCVLLTDTLSFGFALLEGVLVLELGTHGE